LCIPVKRNWEKTMAEEGRVVKKNQENGEPNWLGGERPWKARGSPLIPPARSPTTNRSD